MIIACKEFVAALKLTKKMYLLNRKSIQSVAKSRDWWFLSFYFHNNHLLQSLNEITERLFLDVITDYETLCTHTVWPGDVNLSRTSLWLSSGDTDSGVGADTHQHSLTWSLQQLTLPVNAQISLMSKGFH